MIQKEWTSVARPRRESGRVRITSKYLEDGWKGWPEASYYTWKQQGSITDTGTNETPEKYILYGNGHILPEHHQSGGLGQHGQEPEDSPQFHSILAAHRNRFKEAINHTPSLNDIKYCAKPDLASRGYSINGM